MVSINANYLIHFGKFETYPILGYSFINYDGPENQGSRWRSLIGWGVQRNYQRSVLFLEVTDIWAITVSAGFSYKFNQTQNKP
jgi:hypothetical protein